MADLHLSSIDSSTSFVDYVPPVAVKIVPPAKYKLWLIVFVLVYVAQLVMAGASFFNLLRLNGWLSPSGSQCLLLGIVVGVMVFAGADILVAVLTIRMGKTTYGLGAWLKQPRAKWMYHYDNFVVDCIAGVIRIFEDGFAMFDAPPLPKAKAPPPREFQCVNEACETVLKIEHHINPDKINEYRRWLKKIDAAAAYARGLIKMEKTGILDSNEIDEEMSKHLGVKSPEDDSRLQVVYLTFANIDFLNEWMTSPRRQTLIDALQPILLTPDVVKIQEDRVLPDAFTELLTRQGEGVPERPPKKWKVWWLTTVALNLTVSWTNAFLPYYYEQWNLQEPRLQGLVATLLSTFLNSYVLTPLLLFLFSYWIKRQECEVERKEPWRTLEDGIQWFWLKALITFAFYGGCAIAWVVLEAQR